MNREDRTNDSAAVLELSDAVVACLEDYLPGGVAVDADGGKSMQDRVIATLSDLERRLSEQSRTMAPTEAFRKLVAARQAVQAARLAMQLHHAGNERSQHR